VTGYRDGPLLSPTAGSRTYSFATGTLGVDRQDAGVASAMVNTAQQIGGSIGTALLSTIFADAVSGYLASHARTPSLLSDASVHGYAVGFTAGTVILAVGLVLALVLLPSRHAMRARAAAGSATPVSAASETIDAAC
jgi:hypothetical protein